MENRYNTIQHSVLETLRKKVGIKDPDLLGRTDLKMLGLDTLDLVDVILQLEEVFHIDIPDEVQLNTAHDLVEYLYGQSVRQAG